jgi:PIN domain nuclease of toxin-antitoxin system
LKLLFDTNVLIWASHEPERLSTAARSAITNPRNDRFVSLASLWEMQVKHGLGKLTLSGKVQENYRGWLEDLVANLLPIDVGHIGELYKLPLIHRDPFDRMLIAQAISEGLTIVSPDTTMSRYGIPVIW